MDHYLSPSLKDMMYLYVISPYIDIHTLCAASRNQVDAYVRAHRTSLHRFLSESVRAANLRIGFPANLRAYDLDFDGEVNAGRFAFAF